MGKHTEESFRKKFERKSVEFDKLFPNARSDIKKLKRLSDCYKITEELNNNGENPDAIRRFLESHGCSKLFPQEKSIYERNDTLRNLGLGS
ncbi:MAG: hypothetical protein J0G32_00405 [Alphaproteobacteria bacterium]|nr:hypothetical protein [Alphaproteobacteria bacterium]OJV13468.1 MAG: hypothetical protein BGO27_04575 [Alphaproteobacteria bacterium 33-17]